MCEGWPENLLKLSKQWEFMFVALLQQNGQNHLAKNLNEIFIMK